MDGKEFDALVVRLGPAMNRRRLAGLLAAGIAARAGWRTQAADTAACNDGRSKCAGMCCMAGTTCIGGVCIPTSASLCLATGGACTNYSDCDVSVGEICCQGQCVNATCARDHCATCDTVCDTALSCTDGVCLSSGACPAGMFRCGAGCCTSVEHCGSGGACEPPDLEFLGVSVACAPTANGPAKLQCSLQRVYGEDWTFSCGVDIGLTIVKPMLAAAKAPKVFKRIEWLALHAPDAINIIDAATARSRLEQVTGVLGVLGMPTDCITGLADVLSGGQYTALELCLADQGCTDLLRSELGF